MSRAGDLEDMVQAAWNRGTQVAFGADPGFSRDELRGLLGVYADELQGLGDPRGELIALDLLRTPTTDDERRAEELTTAWLGRTLATHPNVHTRYGLVGVSLTDSEAELLPAVLASRGGPYVSSVAIFGDAYTVRAALDTLVREVRPWLGALRLIVPASPPGASFANPVIGSELAAHLAEATPALYSLAVSGTCVLRELPHPKLRRLAVDGHEAIGALAGVGAALAQVTDLDFAFQTSGHRADPTTDDLVSLLPAGHLPALRRLDLVRNEPGYQAPAQLGGTVSIFRFFQALAVTRQLTHVRLPSLRTQQDLDLLQATLDKMPALARLELAKVHGRHHHGLRHATAALVIPPSTPWPPADALDEPSLIVELANARAAIVDLREAIAALERCYELLPVDARLAWDDWWEALAEVPFEFPAAALSTALDACGDALRDPRWRELAGTLREALDELPLDATVRVDHL